MERDRERGRWGRAGAGRGKLENIKFRQASNKSFLLLYAPSFIIFQNLINVDMLNLAVLCL